MAQPLEVIFPPNVYTNFADLTANQTFTGTNKFGTSTNYVQIDNSGELSLNGSATVWKDIDFPVIVKTTGVGVPALNTLQGNLKMLQWAVNDSQQIETKEFIHEWKEGSPVTWHVHIITGGTNVDNRYIAFSVEYTWANFGVTLPANVTTTSPDMLIPANTPALTHFIFDIATWTPTGGHVGGHIKSLLKRVAASGTAPTADPFCEMMQLHVECDTMGSKTISTK